MTIYCIDIDDTLSHNLEDDYAHSVPCRQAIEKVNKLFGEGHTIKLYTGRGSFDNTDWRPFLERQLKQWGVKYHELITNKPHADVFIDDKAINTADWLDSNLVKEVERKWGKELWLVNCGEYCSKLLYLPKTAYSEEHYHRIKKETFYCLKGIVALRICGKECIIDPFSRPITILPFEPHLFKGLSNAILLEVSTHHDDGDVVFLSEAYKP